MFSGIVERLATVDGIEDFGAGKRLHIGLAGRVKIGESIAINGVCLTAVGAKKSAVSFDLMPETLKRTNLGALKKGSRVSVERSMKPNDRNSGHFVMGHVDTVGKIKKLKKTGNFRDMWITCDKPLMKFIASKGSVAVDGASLTVVGTGPDWFSVALIPHTIRITTLGIKHEGDYVNIEVDMLARYAHKLLGR